MSWLNAFYREEDFRYEVSGLIKQPGVGKENEIRRTWPLVLAQSLPLSISSSLKLTAWHE